MTDLPQAFALQRLQPDGLADDARRIQRARQIAGVERLDAGAAQPLPEARDLSASLGRQITRLAREAILGGEIRRAVTNEVEPRGRHG